VGFPDDVVRLPLRPERTMRYLVAHREEDSRASVRAFAAFAARHRGEVAPGDAEPA
jgi:hypothetical protein